MGFNRMIVFPVLIIIVFDLFSLNPSVSSQDNLISTYTRIGELESNGGGISIGDGYIYEINYVKDTPAVSDEELRSKLPYWDGEKYEVRKYEWMKEWGWEKNLFARVKIFYSNEHDSLYFKEDTTFSRSKEFYDHTNTWNVNIDDPQIKDLIPSDKLIKAFRKADLDGDGYDEFLVIYTDSPRPGADTKARLTPVNLLIFEKLNDSFKLSFSDLVTRGGGTFIGKVELRDINKNGKVDIVIRRKGFGGSASGFFVTIYEVKE